MDKIGIVGQGFVGTAVKEGLQKYFNILTFDLNKPEFSTNTLVDIVERCKIIFLCLPTPMDNEGKCYTGIVEEVLSEINNYCDIKDYYGNETRTIVLKSTIPPGTTKKLQKGFNRVSLVYNPEFLTEANSIEDYKNQNRIILGGPNEVTAKVKPIFSKAFPKVHVVKTDSTYAEMVKYLTNTFLATKVSFANEMYNVCKGLGVDYDKVIEYAKLDERLGYSHWNVPGPDGDFGFGGHCFPKDLLALRHEANKLLIKTPMLDATHNTNTMVRTNKDWEKMEGRAIINNLEKNEI
jgi:UDPglucose 6-dehydrogenase|tara:strand:+ start:6338 stop:7216 length:879 start_codon:yes stop_codon:yes gene_type:complete